MTCKGLSLNGTGPLAHQEIDSGHPQTVEIQHALGSLQGETGALKIGGNHRGGIVRHKE